MRRFAKSSGAGHKLLVWGSAAILGVLAFTGALVTQSRRASTRWSAFLSGNPQQGEQIFRSKGCVRCHAVNGLGGNVGPDLGHDKSGRSDLSQLVTVMWNHAPRMWERMKAQNVPYPDLTYDDIAQLMTYLYMARHADRPGDAIQGRALFESKGCVRCHAIRGRGANVGPDLAGVPAETPARWIEAMWNHATGMQRALGKAGLGWPQFQGHELRNLYAYVQDMRSAPGAGSYAGDPQKGWQLFQQKSCMTCHAIHIGDLLEGPNLGAGRQLPATFSELGSLMLSHSPQMDVAMGRHSIARPQFTGEEITDVFAFLYSLRYAEPEGSPHVGASVFSWRGCARCHGQSGEGGKLAPSLRGRGRNYNSISLAVALWRHGRNMYEQANARGLGWPTLGESDIGDLLAFLNTPPNDWK